MAVVEMKANPSRADLRVFAALWLVFTPVLGWVLPEIGAGLPVLAGLAAVCLAISVAFNRDVSRRAQAAGLLLPMLLLGVWGIMHVAEGAGAGHWARRIILAAFGLTAVTGAAITLASDRVGAPLYRWWMGAALPIGWSVSHALLGAVFFLVILPIGLVMRLLGRDPLRRRFDSAAASYWEPHAQVRDPRRYFRQF